MRYYYCVNCGNHGDYKFDRKRNLNCEKCDYDDLLKLDTEEYIEYTWGSTEHLEKLTHE